MRKITVIGISLLLFIGITAQATARKLHCWDLNENYVCDIEAEDINNDGKCNALDCETVEPEEPCYAVQQTGQTLCYDADDLVIECAGTGQDGEYQYGTPWPEPRFTDNLDGTVKDNLTGLIWLRDANCFGARLWANALSDANGLESGNCGLTDASIAGDWHLPNVRELNSLIDYGNYGPALPSGHPFINVQSNGYYWSSTTGADLSGGAWGVSMNNGSVSDPFKISLNLYYVWPVRGGN